MVPPGKRQNLQLWLKQGEYDRCDRCNAGTSDRQYPAGKDGCPGSTEKTESGLSLGTDLCTSACGCYLWHVRPWV